MSWLSLIATVLAILRAVTEGLRDRQLIDAATASALLQGLKDAQDAIERAQKARELVRAAHASGGDPRLHDDGFKRPD